MIKKNRGKMVQKLKRGGKSMMKKKMNVDKKYYSLKEYIPALLQSLADESK